MKVLVDRVRCEGHGVCESAAPELFALGEDGGLIAYFEGRDIPDRLQESAEDAVRVCPVAALSIVEGPE